MKKSPPAFQFYPADFLSDEHVVLMSNQELGCYIKLLCYCWREGSVPSDIPRIARLCGESVDAMALLWSAIGSCFIELDSKPGRLINPRLDKERKKQEEYRKERSESGRKGAISRWSGKNGSAMAKHMAQNSSLSSSSSSSNKHIIEIIEYLNEKSGKKFSFKTKATVSHINARLAEGHSVEDFQQVIDIKVSQWLNDINMQRYIRPETLFGTKFESYLNEKRAAPSGVFAKPWQTK